MPIIVNQVEITDDEVHAEMQYHPAGSVDEARHKAARTLVIRQLLMQEAIDKNLLAASPVESLESVESAIDMLIQQEVTVPEATDTVCDRYYRQNPERFTDRKTGELLPLDSVIEHIRHYLHARSLQTGISQYIKILSGKARIAGFDMDQTDSPLVQ